MMPRGMRRWVAALLALTVVPAAGALVAIFVGMDLQTQADLFFLSQTGDDIAPDDVWARWNTVQYHGSQLAQLGRPLFTGALIALFALLAVLARRWDAARRLALAAEAEPPIDAPDQAEATAAS
jgi:hypothetical protein